MELVPVKRFTLIVTEAVSEQPLALVTTTSTTAPLTRLSEATDVSNEFVVTPVVCGVLLTKN